MWRDDKKWLDWKRGEEKQGNERRLDKNWKERVRGEANRSEGKGNANRLTKNSIKWEGSFMGWLLTANLIFFLASFEPCGGYQAEKWWSRNCKTLHLQFIFTNQLRHINLRFPLFTIIAFLLTDFFFFQGREILMRMLEVFVRKFQSIAKHHVPAIFKRWYFILSLVLFFEEIVNDYIHVDLIRTEDQIRSENRTLQFYQFI